MEVRKAKKYEIRKISRLMLEEFSKPPFNEDARMKNVIESLMFYFSTGTVLVALDGNKIVGTAVFLIELWWEGPVVLLEDLAVRNDYKKKGVGKFLMEHVEDIGCKCGAVMVCFSTHKKSSAVRFYSKHGYRIERDTVFMRKNLSSSR